MKKKFVFLIIMIITVFVSGISLSVGAQSPGQPNITAESAMLVDLKSGEILYGKALHQRMYPASLTKIMTGLIAVTRGHPDDVLTVSNNVIASVPRDTANAALSPGEKLTQEQALYTMFLASANDSAVAISEHIGGSVGEFVSMMNSYAGELGASDTHFSNPDGLPDVKNYSSAYDLGLITRAAVQNPELMKYFGAVTYVMPPTNLRNQSVPYATLHKMMKRTRYYYPGIIAGKTGWETMSGHNLVTVARRGGRTLICVTLKSANDASSYQDTQSLLDYGFSLSPPQSGAQYLSTSVKGNKEVLASAFVKKGQELGKRLTPVLKRQRYPSGIMESIFGILAIVCVGVVLYRLYASRQTDSLS
ncbi:MAG TPA: D-alanyl-D-alanine carboxypeptidase family protein [Clostridia bacterium]|nr:D-alanyl-D-alanine carboxypeptidase family protein [Clostridia bacterium]